MVSDGRIIWDRPERSGRGRAPSLSREAITTAAVSLADTQGIEELSMRALAVKLGVGAASLYRYVDRKDQLIELMVDAVIGSDLQLKFCQDWRADLRAYALALRAMILRHPWMAVQSPGRPTLGPNTARYMEQLLDAIDSLGLRIDEMLLMVETIGAFVRGRTIAALAEQDAFRPSALDQEESMLAIASYTERLLRSGPYPQLTRVALDARAPHDPDRAGHSFDLGLERVLDGLATMLPS